MGLELNAAPPQHEAPLLGACWPSPKPLRPPGRLEHVGVVAVAVAVAVAVEAVVAVAVAVVVVVVVVIIGQNH